MSNADKQVGFTEFASSVSASAAANRFPQIGAAQEVCIYQVFIDGPLSESLGDDLRDQRMSDKVLHALTSNLGLDSFSVRDNQRVAELAALRHAWMSQVLVRSANREPLTAQVVDDYERLSEGWTHPWLTAQINGQKRRGMSLRPALSEASAVIGESVRDSTPGTVNAGRIVAQNGDFTVQQTGDREVVVHENSRLSEMPARGSVAVISYYRGRGQVFDTGKAVEVSAPYIDPNTNDLAVTVVDAERKTTQVVLFNSVAALSDFVAVQKLPTAIIEQGLDALANRPKAPPKERPERKAVSDIHLDPTTMALALDYDENGVTYTALFGSSTVFERVGMEYGAPADAFVKARQLEDEASRFPGLMYDRHGLSLTQIKGGVATQFNQVSEANTVAGRYAGPVVKETELHVLQDIGRQSAVIHLKSNLDKVPKNGQVLSVAYSNGRGQVQDKGAEKARGR